MHRIARLATLAPLTPVIGASTWISAYLVAMRHLDHQPHAASRLAVAPLSTMMVAIPTLLVAGVIAGRHAGMVDGTALVLGRRVAATALTWTVASWMFLAVPGGLANTALGTGQTWPLTLDAVLALGVGLLLTVLPWSTLTGAQAVRMRQHWWPAPVPLSVGLGPGVREVARE